MLLVIDNFDSFTYNLVQYFGELGVEQKVFRNDEINVEEILALNPERILLSPGPCTPNEAGCSLDVVQAAAAQKIPLFGVCLGHQSVGQSFGGKVIRASRLMHGKTSPIHHDSKELFADIPDGFAATRYHSLVLEKESFPDCLEITAETDEGEIMGLRHRELPIWGVQFHPESLATEHGLQLLKNFLVLPGGS
jgi:anthranilate synthase/aminodeoxychorismate synthase-like glutamine amidotransferase